MADPWDGKVTQEQRDAAVKLAERMARAAGKTQPAVMVMACSMLIELSAMVQFPDAYVDWKIAREMRASGEKQG
jgi:hypothetical protein